MTGDQTTCPFGQTLHWIEEWRGMARRSLFVNLRIHLCIVFAIFILVVIILNICVVT